MYDTKTERGTSSARSVSVCTRVEFPKRIVLPTRCGPGRTALRDTPEKNKQHEPGSKVRAQRA